MLVFYPGDNSPVCTLQLRSYSEDLNGFEALGAAVLCLSPQDVASHEEFVASQAAAPSRCWPTPTRTWGGAYGILGPLGFYRRSIFVVGPDGVVRYARRSLTNLTYVPTPSWSRPSGPRRPPPPEDPEKGSAGARASTTPPSRLLASNACSPWVSIPGCPVAGTARCHGQGGRCPRRRSGI